MRLFKRQLSIMTAAIMLLTLFISVGGPLAQASAAPRFPDISGSAYIEAIEQLARLKIIGGDEQGFRPLDPIKRSEFCKIVYTLYTGTDDASAFSGKSRFSDVADGAWYNGYVNWASETGIIGGMGDGSFAPDLPVTIEQIIKMLVAASIGELQNAVWPTDYIKAGNDLRLTDKIQTEKTDMPAAREQAAQLAYNAVYTYSRLLEATPDIKFFHTENDRALMPDGAVNLLDYASYKNGDDWSWAMARALSVADCVYVPAGTYKMSTVNVSSGKTVYGDKDKTLFIQLSSSLFSLTGSMGNEIALSRDAEDFSNSFSLKSVSGLAPGDTVYLLSQRNSMLLEDCGYNWCLGRAYKSGRAIFFAEFLTVDSVSGSVLKTVESTIFPSYYADGSRESDPPKPSATAANLSDYPYRRASATVRKLNPVKNVTLRDFAVETVKGTIIKVQYGKNILLAGINAYTPAGVTPEDTTRFCSFSTSLDCMAKNCSFEMRGKLNFDDNNATSSDYSRYNHFYIIAGQNCGFVGCSSTNSTHGFIIATAHKGGTSNRCYVLSCKISRCKWAGLWAQHGSYMITASGNRITDSNQGLKFGGRLNIIENNYIELNNSFSTNYYYVRPTEGGTAGIMMIEGYAVDSVIRGNTIKNCYTGLLIRDGYEDLNRYEYGNILFENNTVEGCRQGVYIWKNSSNTGSFALDIVIRNNHFKETSFTPSDYGVRIYARTRGVTISGNSFSGFDYGVLAEPFASEISIENNSFSSSLAALIISTPTPAEMTAPYHKGLSTRITWRGNKLTSVSTEISGGSLSHVTITR